MDEWRDSSRGHDRVRNGQLTKLMSEYSNRIKAKKGLSDDAKDIQIKALQTGFEKMIEYCEKAECRHKMMASFFNESDLKKCLKNCDFCRIPEKVSQQANALKRNVKRVCTHEVSYKREKRMNYSDMSQGKRKKKRNILDSRMEKEEAARLKTAVQRREAIVRTVIQALDNNSSQTDNQLTSNTIPAICSPRHSAPTTTRLHSLECNQEGDKEWNGIRLLFCFSHLITIKQCIGILNEFH
ncbi:hypothetical protein WR25_26917 [Diploscapter pachys]|uniref:ATP-dependent DNA helicase RecQ zinc-binding domain-containing protein n=1 Tax=Diploscapter pachys TaxID=2018661 RepID=A0A2A2L819_9BILA|nr:hypothetical protein WR25_26917 [Diploscapter pachys]